MSHSVSLSYASAKLSELVHGLAPGDEIVLTENNRPVAKIVPGPPKDEPSAQSQQRVPGTWRGKIIPLDDSETGILEMFEDYSP